MAAANLDGMKRALALVLVAINDTVQEFPDGAPEGPMFAAIQTRMPGITSAVFQRLVDLLVREGKVRRGGGHVLYPVIKAEA